MNAARSSRIGPLKVFLWAVVVALLMGAQPVLGQTVTAQRYCITDLGTLPGGIQSGASDINDRGQVVGWSRPAFGDNRAFLWEDGRMRDLGPLDGNTTFAFDINDLGQVVGHSYDPVTGGESSNPRAFLWEKGRRTNLGTLPGNTNSEAFGINGREQVVGQSYTLSFPTGEPLVEGHAFLWEDGRMRDLGTLAGDTDSIAWDINNLGQVVGGSSTASGERHAFLWEDGRMRDLGTLPGTSRSGASGINSRGQVVGSSEGHAVLWSK